MYRHLQFIPLKIKGKIQAIVCPPLAHSILQSFSKDQVFLVHLNKSTRHPTKNK